MTPKTIAGGIAGTCIAAAAFVVAGFVAIPYYFTDFSSEEFDPGPLLAADGWETVAGSVDIVDDPNLTVTGPHSVRILGTSPRSVLQRTVETDPETDVLFCDVFVRPVAGAGIESGAMVMLGMAFVAFVDAGDQEAAVIVRDFTQSSGWLDTGVRVLVDFGGEAVDFHRLTFRMDLVAEVVDVFIDGILAAHDLQVPSFASSAEVAFRAFGSSLGNTYIDDFFAGEHNPLFDDPLGAGIPAEWLSAMGLDPDLPQRYFRLETGETVIDHFFADEIARRGIDSSDVSPYDPPQSASTSGGLVVFTPFERQPVEVTSLASRDTK